MPKTQQKHVAIVIGSSTAPLSPAQKTFNALIGQIRKKRDRLAALDAAIGPYRTKYASHLAPLLDQLADLQVKLVRSLDAASCEPGVTRAERGLLSELIVELAADLLADRDDPELKALYNAHGDGDYDEEAAVATKLAEEMAALLRGGRGPAPDGAGDDPWSRPPRVSPEDDADADDEPDARHGPDPRQPARQRARQARQHAEAQRLGQSIREVYRKLVSALHPDRETDPAERTRKTALMQRVNEAYAANNLLQLLELQLELEHIDQAALDNIGEERLKHYNAILRGQLSELHTEVSRVEGELREQFGFTRPEMVSPARMMRSLADDIAELQQAIGGVRTDLRELADPRRAKAWIRQLQRLRRMADARDGRS